MLWSLAKLSRPRQPLRRFPLGKIRPTLEGLETRLLPSTNVISYHNDSSSTGQNLQETQLTRANVNATTFGKLFTAQVDGQVYAQPLVVSNVNITTGAYQGLHDVVFVATEHDSLYAIDATQSDGNGHGIVLWQTSFLNSGLPGATSITPVLPADVNSNDITVEIGITGTPVIDAGSNTLYLVAKTKETVDGVAHYVQRLHAVNLSDGSEKVAPFLIGDTVGIDVAINSPIFVNGNGYGNDGQGHIYFNALRENQRAALTLINGTVYVAWASHGDNGFYHGWVVGFDAATLSPNAVFNDTPNGLGGGIWQAGGALSFDGQYLYFETGNGTFDGDNGNTTKVPQPGTVTGLDANGFPLQGDYGDSFVKLAIDPTTSATNQNINGWGLQVVDYFTPFDQDYLDATDSDLGSGAPLVLPDSVGSVAHPHLLVGAGKEGKIYLLDRDNMGKFGVTDNVVQTLEGQLSGSLDTAAYYNNTIYYVEGYGGTAKTFSISNGVMSATPTSRSADSFSFAGSTPSISANGSSDGIVWDVDTGTSQLRAYSSDSYAIELYNSGQAAGSRDALGAAVKFEVATVANGHVYLGAGTGNPNNFLVVYGLINPVTAPPVPPTLLAATPVSTSQINLTWIDNDQVPNQADGYTVETSPDGSTGWTVVGVAGPGATSFAVGGLLPATTYFFRVRAFNSMGSSAYTNIVSAQTSSGLSPILDFSNGFASGTAGVLTFNGGAGVFVDRLRMTDGGHNEATSVFSTAKVDITHFTSTFRFQIAAGDNTADGFTFTLQNVAPTALGGPGGYLGYAGILNSVALKFDLFGDSDSTTGLYTDGAAPLAPSIDLIPSGIDLHSGDIMNVTVNYDGSTLQVTIVDTNTSQTASQSYAVDIRGHVGGDSAYVGFTAGTGGYTATQDLLSWSYQVPSSSAVPPGIPGNVAAVVTGYTASSTTAVPLGVTLTWDDVPGETGFKIERKLGATGTYSQIGQVAASVTTFKDTGLATQATYYYRVRAFNAVGDGAYSAEVPVTTPARAPTPTNGQALVVTTTSITLAWTDNANNEDGFKIYRSVSGGTFSLLKVLPPHTAPSPSIVLDTDTGLTPGTHYDYHIQAFNLAGYSDFAGVSTTTKTSATVSTTTSLTESTATAAYGQSVTFTATVQSTGLTTPTGAVDFLKGATFLGTATLTAGVASFSTAALPPGFLSITAVYRGDSVNLGSTSPSVTITVGSPNQRFVEKVYQDLLHRDVDPFGLDYWGSQLDAGANPADIVLGIESSQEYRIDLVQSLYQQLLRRTADPFGLSYWVGALEAGATQEQIEGGIAGSDEYLQRFGSGTNEGYLDALYQDLLRRPIDPVGQSYWESVLDSGASREEVARLISSSEESERNVVAAYYQAFQGRPADSDGLNYWTHLLLSGTRREQIVAGIMSSSEFLGQV